MEERLMSHMVWTVVVVTLLVSATAVSALPVCPLSGLPPQEPLVPPTRCPDAASLSCCKDCADRRMTMQLVSSDIDKVVNTIIPGDGHVPVSYSYKMCNFFSTVWPCQTYIEQLMCAFNCNPDSGNYVKVSQHSVTLTVCRAYAYQMYEACRFVTIPGYGTAASVLVSPESFLKIGVPAFLSNLNLLPPRNLTAVISEKASRCYAGPQALPETKPCCDPFSSMEGCPSGTVKKGMYYSVLLSQPDPLLCGYPAPAPAPSPPPAAALPPDITVDTSVQAPPFNSVGRVGCSWALLLLVALVHCVLLLWRST